MANPRFLSRNTHHINKTMMKCCAIVIGVVLTSFTLTGCTGATSFRVLDAHTKEPIQGAITIAMWTKTKGLPGLTSRYTAKAVEAETALDGTFTVPGVVGTLALQTPHLKVYKPGYVGWDSRLIYLGCNEKDSTIPVYKSRKEFSMTDQDIYLEPWKEEYTYISHYDLIQVYANLRKEAGLSNSKYKKAIDHEVAFRIKERETLRRKRK